MHVSRQQVVQAVHGQLGELILRGAGTGVDAHVGDHTAQPVVRVDLVAQAHRLSGGHQLVVHGLPAVLLGGDLREHTSGDEGAKGHGEHIDLVEGEPAAHLALVPLHHRLGVVDEEVHQLAVFPPPILGGQVQGIFIVGQGDQGLDAVLGQLVKHLVVKGQPLLVGLLLIPPGEDAGPGDGHAVDLEAHLSKQGDVLFPVMVEVGGLVIGIEGVRLGGDGDAAGGIHRAPGEHVVDGGASAPFVPSTLILVGGSGTAP